MRHAAAAGRAARQCCGWGGSAAQQGKLIGKPYGSPTLRTGQAGQADPRTRRGRSAKFAKLPAKPLTWGGPGGAPWASRAVFRHCKCPGGDQGPYSERALLPPGPRTSATLHGGSALRPLRRTPALHRVDLAAMAARAAAQAGLRARGRRANPVPPLRAAIDGTFERHWGAVETAAAATPLRQPAVGPPPAPKFAARARLAARLLPRIAVEHALPVLIGQHPFDAEVAAARRRREESMESMAGAWLGMRR